jgi:hypothetical protein
VVAQDVRGRYGSDCEFEPNVNQTSDGADIMPGRPLGASPGSQPPSVRKLSSKLSYSAHWATISAHSMTPNRSLERRVG